MYISIAARIKQFPYSLIMSILNSQMQSGKSTEIHTIYKLGFLPAQLFFTLCGLFFDRVDIAQ
jgi:hypothetical protein